MRGFPRNLILMVLAVLVVASLTVWWANSSETDPADKVVPPTAQEPNGDNDVRLPDNLFTYRGVAPGMTGEQVKDVLGEPDEAGPVEPYGPEISIWRYDESVLYFTEDRLVTISPPETATGIRLGDSSEKVLSALGEGERIQSRHSEDPAYYVRHYAKGDQNIWFCFDPEGVKFIQIGEPFFD